MSGQDEWPGEETTTAQGGAEAAEGSEERTAEGGRCWRLGTLADRLWAENGRGQSLRAGMRVVVLGQHGALVRAKPVEPWRFPESWARAVNPLYEAREGERLYEVKLDCQQGTQAGVLVGLGELWLEREAPRRSLPLVWVGEGQAYLPVGLAGYVHRLYHRLCNQLDFEEVRGDVYGLNTQLSTELWEAAAKFGTLWKLLREHAQEYDYEQALWEEMTPLTGWAMTQQLAGVAQGGWLRSPLLRRLRLLPAGWGQRLRAHLVEGARRQVCVHTLSHTSALHSVTEWKGWKPGGMAELESGALVPDYVLDLHEPPITVMEHRRVWSVHVDGGQLPLSHLVHLLVAGQWVGLSDVRRPLERLLRKWAEKRTGGRGTVGRAAEGLSCSQSWELAPMMSAELFRLGVPLSRTGMGFLTAQWKRQRRGKEW